MVYVNNSFKKVLFLLFAIQIIPNVISFIIFYIDGQYELEREIYDITNYENLFISLSTFFLMFFFILGVYFLTKKNNREIKINYYGYSCLIVFLQVSYFIVNIIYGTNLAGHSSRGEMPIYISYFFVLFNPDLLFLIYLFASKDDKLKNINILIYLISNVTRGWMGGILYIIVYYYMKTEIKIKKLLLILSVIILFIAILPFIVNAKWYFRSGGGFTSIIDIFHVDDYFSSLFLTFKYILFRFQHISSIIFTTEHLNIIKNGEFSKYWEDGNIQLILLRIFDVHYVTLNNFLVTNVMGFRNATWNIHTGISSWLIINPFDMFIFIYGGFLVYIANNIPIVRVSERMQAFILYITFSRLFLGWFSAYFNFIIALFISLLIIKILSVNAKNSL